MLYFSQMLVNISLMYAIIEINHGFSIHYGLRGPLGVVENLGFTSGFNISIGTRQTLMYEKPNNRTKNRMTLQIIGVFNGHFIAVGTVEI